jgi:thymidylate synthase ThyX
MTITAKIICDSISEAGVRLTTMQLRYPRFIHAEELTHRILSSTPEEIVVQQIADGVMYDRNLSRNASSSRAIPVERLIKDVMEDTAMPLFWGKNQPGMQAREECDAGVLGGYNPYQNYHGAYSLPFNISREEAWKKARDEAVKWAKRFYEAGYHKQIVNRLLEPFCHINVVVTATEWSNFFELRDHSDAQPEIMVLAQAMKKAMAESTPNLLKDGEWHLPYISEQDRKDILMTIPFPCFDDGKVITKVDDRGVIIEREYVKKAIKCSVARCARVSYLTHDAKPPVIAKDIDLYDKLIVSKPAHASPCEHQATPDFKGKGFSMNVGKWMNLRDHGNFIGWRQHRKMIGL